MPTLDRRVKVGYEGWKRNIWSPLSGDVLRYGEKRDDWKDEVEQKSFH